MMILSRIWYVILAILLAAAYYVVALAVGQYNRRNQAAMDETIKADSQVVKWSLEVDARRRLDVLLLASGDKEVIKAIKNANAKDPIPPASKNDGANAVREFNDKKTGDFKFDAIFLADREGRLVAQVGYDSLNAFPDFELGGYPAVFDALHGFVRDDTWVLGGKIARIVSRPVEDEVGQAPLGAVIGLRWVDASFAKEISKRTRTNIGFFVQGSLVASAVMEGGLLDENALSAVGTDLAGVSNDEQFKKIGRTDVRPLVERKEDKGGVLFMRLPGDAWELGAGFAVARPKVAIGGPMGFINGADDQDKRNVKLWLVALVFLGATLIGIGFSFLEHSMPLREMASQSAKLRAGTLDQLQLPRFRGGLRGIATDINAGIQRVVEKGGGMARKPADLESILGPVPAQPNMSAFSFPMPDGSVAAPAPAMGPASAPGGGLGPPPPPFPGAAPSAPGSTTARNQGFNPPPPLNRPGAPPSRPGGLPAPFAAPPAPASAPKTNTAPAAFTPATPSGAGLPRTNEDGDEETMVAQPSADLLAATGQNAVAGGDPTAEWQKVYEDFIRTKKECKEAVDGLTFEKFQQTLKKNRDALIQRHGCKRVKFSVYVKEGRASLKATPVRE